MIIIKKRKKFMQKNHNKHKTNQSSRLNNQLSKLNRSLNNQPNNR